MDILDQYNQENPQKSFDASFLSSSEECGALTCSLIQLSGGRIKSVRQANGILLVIAAVMIIASIIIIASAVGGTTPTLPPSAT